MLDKIKTVYKWIDSLNSSVKSVIILVFFILGSQDFIVSNIKNVIAEQEKKEIIHKKSAQRYARAITPEINRCLQTILDKDQYASNILLLNYHNSISSSHGLSYLYITAIVEKRKGLEAKSCISCWKELEYMTYGEEFDKINNNNILRMDSIEGCYEQFPNLSYLVQRSRFKTAAFYPIKLHDNPVGMLVVLYKTPRPDWHEYYPKYLAQSIIEIAEYLDYDEYLINKQK